MRVETKQITENVYIAYDGKKFKSKDECIEYERLINYRDFLSSHLLDHEKYKDLYRKSYNMFNDIYYAIDRKDLINLKDNLSYAYNLREGDIRDITKLEQESEEFPVFIILSDDRPRHKVLGTTLSLREDINFISSFIEDALLAIEKEAKNGKDN